MHVAAKVRGYSGHARSKLPGIVRVSSPVPRGGPPTARNGVRAHGAGKYIPLRREKVVMQLADALAKCLNEAISAPFGQLSDSRIFSLMEGQFGFLVEAPSNDPSPVFIARRLAFPHCACARAPPHLCLCACSVTLSWSQIKFYNPRANESSDKMKSCASNDRDR